MNLPEIERRKIAQTALEIPILGLGTAHLGELYGVVKEADSQATLQSAWAAGVRYYDTAPWYGRGLAEHRLGGFLRTQPRQEFQITTKVGRTLHRPSNLQNFSREPWLGGLNFEVNFDYTYEGIMRSYEQALQRLALDTVDALVIHDLDALFHDDETMTIHKRDIAGSGIKALEELKSSGDIQAYGMGINTNAALLDVASLVDLDFVLVAMPYTLLDQESLDSGMADCVKRGRSVIIGAPFASGILVTGSSGSSKYGYADAPTEIKSKVNGLEAVCANHNVNLAAAALQFVLAHPAVAAAIPGAARPHEIRENVALLQAPIPADFWIELKSKSLIHTDAPTPASK